MNNANLIFRYVKEKRPSISPNFNFLGQLLEYERDLNSTRNLQRFEEKKQQLLQPLSPAVSSPGSASTLQNKPDFGRPATNFVKAATDSGKSAAIVAAQAKSIDDAVDGNQELFSSPAAKIGKRTSQGSVNLTFDNSSPANETNVFGKRQMEPEQHAACIIPRNFGTLASIRKTCLELGAFSVLLKPVQEDLPSPSTEMSRLSFDQKPDTPFPFVCPSPFAVATATSDVGERFAVPTSIESPSIRPVIVQNNNNASAVAIKPDSTNVPTSHQLVTNQMPASHHSVTNAMSTPDHSATNPLFTAYQLTSNNNKSSALLEQQMEDARATSQGSSTDGESLYGIAGSCSPSFTSLSGSQTDSGSASNSITNINASFKTLPFSTSRSVKFCSTNPNVWDGGYVNELYASTSYTSSLSVENPMFAKNDQQFIKQQPKKAHRLVAARISTKREKKYQDKKIVSATLSATSSYRLTDVQAICGKRVHERDSEPAMDSAVSDEGSAPSTPPIGKQQTSSSSGGGKKFQLSSMSQKFTDFLHKRMSWPHVTPYISRSPPKQADMEQLSESKNIPSKSKSESAMLYTLSGKRSSSCPQSSAALEFLDIENPTALLSERSSMFQDSLSISHHCDAERESMGSSSSLEIAVS